jgi:hypothetical protein
MLPDIYPPRRRARYSVVAEGGPPQGATIPEFFLLIVHVTARLPFVALTSATMRSNLLLELEIELELFIENEKMSEVFHSLLPPDIPVGSRGWTKPVGYEPSPHRRRSV